MTNEEITKDQQNRASSFTEEYKALVEKYEIEVVAVILKNGPAIELRDRKEYEEKKKAEEPKKEDKSNKK